MVFDRAFGGKFMRKCVVMFSMPIIVVLGGCAHENWAPAAGKDPNSYTQDKARCAYIARHGNQTSWYAYGKTEQVAAYGLGVAIGDAVGAARDFDDCMQMLGWEMVDGEQVPQPTGYSTPPAVAASPPAASDPRNQGWRDTGIEVAPPQSANTRSEIRPAPVLQGIATQD